MPNPHAPIRFHFLYSFNLKERRKLKLFIRNLFAEEKKGLDSLDYIFCSDSYLLQINQDFLQHDELTDIITFDLSLQKEKTMGEIYISVERVAENALLFGHPVGEEIKRVMFHGALHLCGYRDKSRKEVAEMRKKENDYLGKYHSFG